VVAMYLKEDRDAEIALSWPLKSSIAICLAGTLLLGLLPEQALRQVKRSAATVVAAMK